MKRVQEEVKGGAYADGIHVKQETGDEQSGRYVRSHLYISLPVIDMKRRMP